jgi:hypothetical protein
MYIVVFDDGRFLGHGRWPVREFPDAKLFTSKSAAERASRKVNLPSTVALASDY